ncbi:MAG: tetratricopeptide repeat protein [Candidatus Riflebacteria bacterium]|nr:tetratricopeptide repeat protein [Candidatus Riflebacteria bacterium]
MNRLKKSLLLSVLFVSLLSSNTNFCNSVYAQSSEARELNRKGVLCLESGRFDEAVVLLKKAMALEPKWGEPCYNAARLLRLKGKREEMTKMLRKANGVEPDNPTYAEEYLKILT